MDGLLESGVCVKSGTPDHYFGAIDVGVDFLRIGVGNSPTQLRSVPDFCISGILGWAGQVSYEIHCSSLG